jgi:hypothetical protein
VSGSATGALRPGETFDGKVKDPNRQGVTMSGSIGGQFVLATISKHDIGGIIAIVVGVVVLVFGLLRAAIRAAMLAISAVVVIIGILLLTRTL